MLIAENRCAALFVSTVSPDSETRIGAAVWRPVSIVPPFTRPDTWPKAPRLARRVGQSVCRSLTASAAEHLSRPRCELTR